MNFGINRALFCCSSDFFDSDFALSKQIIFSGTLTQNISSLNVSNQTNLVKRLLT